METVGLTSQDLYAPSIAPNPARLLVVVGPTGTGKSVWRLHLAHALHGEIVNCDSVQVYRGLEIGSAKLPPRERRGIPHHLIDIVEPDEDLTAGRICVARPGRAVPISKPAAYFRSSSGAPVFICAPC